MSEFVAWAATRRPTAWPNWIDSKPGPPPPAWVGPGRLRVTFVNHATLLVQVDGLNILTDPIWSYRAGPVSWAGSRRRRAPGIRFEDLPRIDVVLVSHNHFDHMDTPTLKRLASRDHPVIITGLGNGAVLQSDGLDGAVELDWWDVLPVGGGVQITAVPAQHMSMRGALRS